MQQNYVIVTLCISSCCSAGSQRPHRCHPLVINIEFIGCAATARTSDLADPMHVVNDFIVLYCVMLLCLDFSALSLLVGCHEEHPACKN